MLAPLLPLIAKRPLFLSRRSFGQEHREKQEEMEQTDPPEHSVKAFKLARLRRRCDHIANISSGHQKDDADQYKDQGTIFRIDSLKDHFPKINFPHITAQKSSKTFRE